VLVVGAIAASRVWGLDALRVATIGPISGGWPSFGLPLASWSETLQLLPIAASCFVVIITQSAATARAFASRYQERTDENADIVGLAVANGAAAISGGFVVNGSPTQTAMADRAGGRSSLKSFSPAAYSSSC
jgi:SulP family sulfate permease